MSYILGYIAADGCITERKNKPNTPYSLNITSADYDHLIKIRKVLLSDYSISLKSNSTPSKKVFQLQMTNQTIVTDLFNLGIFPRKTFNLSPIDTPKKYFPDFVRGFFDGDGSVYIYNVNNVPQIKACFGGTNKKFISDLNQKICPLLNIPLKNINRTEDRREGRATSYRFTFYIDDCEKLMKFMYGHTPTIYMDRKYKIFQKWQKIKGSNRRQYKKQNYPSKIGWHLNPNLGST
jgi:hypothetical protein